ncbi:phosphate signaling complex protein PhoU [Chakrabartyella piscis]|uniref:phosphate signaling complex protein PhoU n=1 Tax=Chakrabartyella piscis TaxID=2918914 RepID=UPI002958DF22|nr:phosphate signaling complex protein PhoU [Chakrabartyella piscis]
MRTRYNEQLNKLHLQIVTMGTMCEQAISKATKALTEGDMVLAGEVVAGDAAVNQQERDVEALCLKLLLQQQPVASDLRKISSILKMLTDLERIGDQAADIAEIVKKNNLKLPEKYLHVCKMGVAAVGMVSDAIAAYVNNDLELAKEVIARDDEVDELFTKVRTELLNDLAKDNHTEGEILLNLFMVIKYYERIGDHATNVAEWVAYALTGEKA